MKRLSFDSRLTFEKKISRAVLLFPGLSKALSIFV